MIRLLKIVLFVLVAILVIWLLWFAMGLLPFAIPAQVRMILGLILLVALLIWIVAATARGKDPWQW